MFEIEPVEIKKQRRLAIIWGITFLIVFPLLITLGYLMRLNQGEMISLSPGTFYALMTLHGLGMVGLLFSIAFVGLWYLISTRYARLSIKLGYFYFFAILIGVLGLTIATLIGEFGAGWYLLYPLPFKGTNWAPWATKMSIISLIILGVAWIIGIVHIVYALAKEYGGFTNLLGWQYLRKKEDRKEIPPVVLITTISLVPGLIAYLAGAVVLIMYLLQSFEPSLSFDPLLMKNLMFFFGHTLPNITMYACIGWVYALLPEFTGRPWKLDKILVLSWNATFFFILFAYFHHLYMDFVQPLPMQYLGQLASYFSAVPATAITMFGVITQLYHSKIKWSIIPLTFLIGVAGWAIGGFAAVVDSTIAINKVFHNTLWVPAHFHTYMLLGVVLFIFGLLFYIFSGEDKVGRTRLANLGFWLYVIGGYGFMIMFYLGGMESIPRRFADYKGINIKVTHAIGVDLAQLSVWFISLLSIGLLIMYAALIIKLINKKPLTDLSVQSI